MYEFEDFKKWVEKNCPTMNEFLRSWENTRYLQDPPSWTSAVDKIKRKEVQLYPHHYLVKEWVNEVEQERLKKVETELKNQISTLTTQLTEKAVDYEESLKLEDRVERLEQQLGKVKKKLGKWVKLVGERKPEVKKGWSWW